MIKYETIQAHAARFMAGKLSIRTIEIELTRGLTGAQAAFYAAMMYRELLLVNGSSKMAESFLTTIGTIAKVETP